MGKTYCSYLPEQALLPPPDLCDRPVDDYLAYFVSELVDELDLGVIERYYEAETHGQSPFHPRLMVKLLVYGYCLGVRSSRKIARRKRSPKRSRPRRISTTSRTRNHAS